MLFWATIALMIVSVVSMIVYHISGRHAHEDFKSWYAQLTTAHLIAFSTMLGKLVLLAIGVAVGFRVIRRLRVFLEIQVHHYLPKHVAFQMVSANAAPRPDGRASASGGNDSPLVLAAGTLRHRRHRARGVLAGRAFRRPSRSRQLGQARAQDHRRISWSTAC